MNLKKIKKSFMDKLNEDIESYTVDWLEDYKMCGYDTGSRKNDAGEIVGYMISSYDVDRYGDVTNISKDYYIDLEDYTISSYLNHKVYNILEFYQKTHRERSIKRCLNDIAERYDLQYLFNN